ncbi:CotD family spore coat protein [Bacillus infantis]|uniref:CotD family spore coat protein n=1 Tax=Bacillus infantis TaxID=324767 RepID=UPI002002E112|nr:CotD family spore coat protein [Bacillus infantis]MCK6205578.1 spore coat protein [Bacillus infantis]
MRCNCRKCRERAAADKTIVSPTDTVVRNNTRTKTIRRIHPTEIVNVNRTIIRNENYFPVTERTVNETIVENFDCGRDPNNNRNCRRI